MFDGRRDKTIDRGIMRQWRQYTTVRFRTVPVDGDHYFVSKLYQQVRAHMTCVQNSVISHRIEI